MKRRITFSIALAVGVLLSLTSFAIPAQKDAPARRVFMAGTGIVSLGPNEKLRLSCVTRDGSATTTIAFRHLEYAQGPCNGGVCTLTPSSDTTTAPVMLMPGEGVVFEVPGGNWKDETLTVLSSRQDVRVVFEVIDMSTQSINAIWTQPLE